MVIQHKHVNKPINMHNRVIQNLNLIRNLKFLVKIQNIKIRILALTDKSRKCNFKLSMTQAKLYWRFTEHFHQSSSKSSPFTNLLKATRLLNSRIILNLKTAKEKKGCDILLS